MLILGGMFEELLELAGPTISESLHRGIYDAAHQRVELVTPKFGRDAVLIGAAEMGLQLILDDPASVPLCDSRLRVPFPFPARPEPVALAGPEFQPAAQAR